jgi:hypothetical protein
VPIRARIALVVLAVSAALIFIGVWFFDRQLVAGVHETIDETLDARAAPLVAVLADSSGPLDRSLLTRGVVSIPASLAHILGPDGTVVASSLGSPDEAAAMLPMELLGQLDRRRYFVVTTDLSPTLEEIRVLTVPVDRSDGTWTVVVGSSLEITERAQSVRTGFILGGVVAVAMTTVGARPRGAVRWTTGTAAAQTFVGRDRGVPSRSPVGCASTSPMMSRCASPTRRSTRPSTCRAAVRSNVNSSPVCAPDEHYEFHERAPRGAARSSSAPRS